MAALNDEIARREEALSRAGEADREALTRWQLEDGKGDRPQPTVPAIEQEIAAKKADRDAALAEEARRILRRTQWHRPQWSGPA